MRLPFRFFFAPAQDMASVIVDLVIGKPVIECIFEIPLGLDDEAEQRQFRELMLKCWAHGRAFSWLLEAALCGSVANPWTGARDGEAQAATGGGEDGEGALTAAGLASPAATVMVRWWRCSGVIESERRVVRAD